eukprot:m.44807 g.44807  ORF g.44807 m.44807 type:complete len:342 (-) comp10146_c0_seq3:112-1137(-)
MQKSTYAQEETFETKGTRKKHLRRLAKAKARQNTCSQRSDEATNELLIWNVSTNAGHTVGNINAILEDFNVGKVSAIRMDLGTDFASVLYESLEASIEAQKILNEKWIPKLERYISVCFGNTNSFVERRTVPGLEVVHDLVSEEEEEDILKALSHYPCELLTRRKVQHFGYRFDYSQNDARAKSEADFPSFNDWLLPRIAVKKDTDSKHAYDGMKMKQWPDQLTVNIYEPGGGIPPHVDSHSPFEESIASLSLGSDIVIEFWPIHVGKKGCVNVHLPRRSLMIMNGEARYAWQHGIAARKTDILNHAVVNRLTRTSLTYRTIRIEPCQCQYPACCDHDRNS